jgi:hypothetical protein
VPADDSHLPPVLPYADSAVPSGLDDVQIFRVGHELRRVTVPHGVSFEVTPFAFRLTTTGPLGVRVSTWPRSNLTEVRVNRFNNHIVLRLAGQDPLEVNVGLDPVGTERVMHEVIASTTVIPVAPAHRQVVAQNLAGGLPPSPARTSLLRLSVGLCVVALVFVPLVPLVSLITAVLAIIPIGLAFGTQRRDQWP